MKKKIFAILIGVSMLAALLSGCSGDNAATTPGSDANNTGNANAGQTASSLYPVTEEPITLTAYQAVGGVYGTYLQNDGWNAYPTFQAAEATTNVHIEWNILSQDVYQTQFNIMVMGGDYPDLMAQPASAYSGEADALVEDGICIDLTPLLATYAPDYMEKVYNKYDIYAKQATTDSGRIVTINTLSQQISAGMVIRKDWVEKLNLEMPETYDEIHDVLMAFKTELDIAHPMIMTSTLTYSANIFYAGMDVATPGSGDLASANSGDLAWQLDDNGNVVATCLTPQFKEFLMMLNQWYNDGLLTDLSLSLANTQAFDAHAKANEVGFWGTGTSALSADFAAGSDDSDFHAYPVAEPTPTGAESVRMGPVSNTMGSAGWGISTQCEYPEAALSYINWFFTDEGYQLTSFGKEGVTYTLDESGNKQLTELITNNPEGMSSTVALAMYSAFGGGFAIISSIEKTAMGFTTQAQKDSQEIWGADDNSHTYYGTLTADESSTYSSRASDISTLLDENMSQFVYGQKSFDEFDELIETIKSMGIDELTSIKQEAYDRFMAR